MTYGGASPPKPPRGGSDNLSLTKMTFQKKTKVVAKAKKYYNLLLMMITSPSSCIIIINIIHHQHSTHEHSNPLSHSMLQYTVSVVPSAFGISNDSATDILQINPPQLSHVTPRLLQCLHVNLTAGASLTSKIAGLDMFTTLRRHHRRR